MHTTYLAEYCSEISGHGGWVGLSKRLKVVIERCSYYTFLYYEFNNLTSLFDEMDFYFILNVEAVKKKRTSRDDRLRIQTLYNHAVLGLWSLDRAILRVKSSRNGDAGDGSDSFVVQRSAMKWLLSEFMLILVSISNANSNTGKVCLGRLSGHEPGLVA